MSVFETFDATWVNAIVNKPAIKAQFGLHLPDAPIDLSECARRADYKIITNGRDAFMLADEVSPVLFHCHSIFDETCRGRKAVDAGKALVQWMWDNTPALVLFGATPVENRAARMFNRWIGATTDGIKPFASVNCTFEAEWFHIVRPQPSSMDA